MKWIRLIIISVVVFFLILTGFSLFIPGQVRVSRAVDIYTSGEKVLAQIANVENWKNWYPGADSAQLIIKDGKPKGLSVSPDADLGMVISETTDTSVVATLVGVKSRNTQSVWNLYQYDSARVAVNWYMDVKLRWYPWEKFAALLFEKKYGPMMELGLQQLKKEAEGERSNTNYY